MFDFDALHVFFCFENTFRIRLDESRYLALSFDTPFLAPKQPLKYHWIKIDYWVWRSRCFNLGSYLTKERKVLFGSQLLGMSYDDADTEFICSLTRSSHIRLCNIAY